MKLYKFKSLDNFQYVADILCNNRFHAAVFNDLNDPMEGLFEFDPRTHQDYVSRIVNAKRKQKICSFSQSYSNLLLWAHYASGFQGICIEIDIPDITKLKPVEVNYSPFSVYVGPDKERDIRKLTRDILRCKNDAWRYEEEVRILTSEDYIDSGFTISAIYFGLRTSDVMKQAVSSIVSDNVALFDTKIGQSNSVEKCEHDATAC